MRIVCVSFLLLITLVVPATARAEIITNLIGDVQLTPLAIDVASPSDAVNANGTLHIVGKSASGEFVRQTIDLSTGSKSSLQAFVGQNASSVGASVFAVQSFSDGSVIYLGESANGVVNSSATYWHNPALANGAASGTASTGFLLDAGADSTFVGSNQGAASAGSPNSVLQPLPGNVVGIANSISHDSSTIAGDSIWSLGQSGYEQLSTLGFDIAPNSVGLPTTWDAVEIDPVTGDGVLSGSYLDSMTFTNTQGFWRTDGTFLFGEANAAFSDFEIYEGQLVAALNGTDDGILYAITDGSRLTMEELRGEKTKFAGKGLYQGSAGFVLEGSGGNIFITSHSTTAVPEPSSIALCIVASAALALRRKRSRARRTAV